MIYPRVTNIRKRILNFRFLLFSLTIILINNGCIKEWDGHYNPTDTVFNQKIWDNIQEQEDFSIFTDLIIRNKLDSLLKNNQQYTLFIPGNAAFENIPDSIKIDHFILSHLISPTIFNLRNIKNYKKLQTVAGKFAHIEMVGSHYFFEEKEIVNSSPLFLNGRYYEVNELPIAKPNLKEYLKDYLPVIYEYINNQAYDSLDKAASTPISFDNEGNTIYDSVFISINPFENKYYQISKESRMNFATLVLFTQQDYNTALNEMAVNMGGIFKSFEDIPLKWQESVLIPILLDNGIFNGMLSIEELTEPNLLNINGETVDLDVHKIDPESRILCSNGIVYHQRDFKVDESLYRAEIRKEGESLLDSVGQDKYSWKESVQLDGKIVEPALSFSSQASNGKAVIIGLGRSFSGEFSIEFSIKNILPGRHRLQWRANYRPSGIFIIYINDEPIGEFDTFNLRYSIPSITGEVFRPSSAGFNSVDFWVNNITEYGDVKVKFEFKESGISTDNGMNIDYVSLIPDPIN